MCGAVDNGLTLSKVDKNKLIHSRDCEIILNVYEFLKAGFGSGT
jgi:hypothetical protein